MKPKKYTPNERENPSSPQNSGTRTPLSPKEKKKKLKTALILLGIAAVLYAALKILLDEGYLWVFVAYEIAASIPIIVYVIIVRGRLGKLPLPDELPEEWSESEKLEFLETEKQRRKDGKVYLYIATPLIIAILVAFVTEFYLPMIFGA